MGLPVVILLKQRTVDLAKKTAPVAGSLRERATTSLGVVLDMFYCTKRYAAEETKNMDAVMANRLLGAVHNKEKLIRVDVDFEIRSGLVDQLLGRPPHNVLIESRCFMRTLASTYGRLLQ